MLPNKIKEMETENTQAQMNKSVLEFCLLCITSEKDAYTLEIVEAMKNAKLIVVEGTLYPILMRLKNDGFLSYEWKESTSGPPRKYYKITEAGKKQLFSLRASWQQLVNSVNLVAATYSPNI